MANTGVSLLRPLIFYIDRRRITASAGFYTKLQHLQYVRLRCSNQITEIWVRDLIWRNAESLCARVCWSTINTVFTRRFRFINGLTFRHNLFMHIMTAYVSHLQFEWGHFCNNLSYRELLSNIQNHCDDGMASRGRLTRIVAHTWKPVEIWRRLHI